MRLLRHLVVTVVLAAAGCGPVLSHAVTVTGDTVTVSGAFSVPPEVPEALAGDPDTLGRLDEAVRAALGGLEPVRSETSGGIRWTWTVPDRSALPDPAWTGVGWPAVVRSEDQVVVVVPWSPPGRLLDAVGGVDDPDTAAAVLANATWELTLEAPGMRPDPATVRAPEGFEMSVDGPRVRLGARWDSLPATPGVIQVRFTPAGGGIPPVVVMVVLGGVAVLVVAVGVSRLRGGRALRREPAGSVH